MSVSITAASISSEARITTASRVRRRLQLRTWLICVLLVPAICLLVVVSGAVGPVQVSLREAAQVVAGHLLPGMPWMSDGSLSQLQDQTVCQFRLPRALLAGLAGAGAAVLRLRRGAAEHRAVACVRGERAHGLAVAPGC